MITIRNLCLFFAFLLFSASFISAISTDMSKEYSGGETVVVKLSGNILEPIDPSQVEFKKENVRVPFSYDLKKLGDGKYYLWFVTPSNAVIQNYTLLIKGISTTVDGVVEKIDFMQNFTVLQTANEYYIEPGFIFTKEDFQISATLNRDEDTNIEIDFPNQHTITLMSGKNNLDFSIRDFVSTAFLLIRVGKYTSLQNIFN